MEIVPGAALKGGQPRHTIDVADETLIFRSVPIEDLSPTGAPSSPGPPVSSLPVRRRCSIFCQTANWRTSGLMRLSIFPTARAASSSPKAIGSTG